MKKKAKKFAEKFGVFLDSFLVLGIFLVVIFSVLSVLNMTPKYKPYPKRQDAVLGTTDSEYINLISGENKQDGISTEKITQTSDESFTIFMRHMAHGDGTYKNEAFTIVNQTPEDKTISVSSAFEEVSDGTQISLLVDNVKYVILSKDGTMYPPSIHVESGETIPVSVQIESENDVSFSTDFVLNVGVE